MMHRASLLALICLTAAGGACGRGECPESAAAASVASGSAPTDATAAGDAANQRRSFSNFCTLVGSQLAVQVRWTRKEIEEGKYRREQSREELLFLRCDLSTRRCMLARVRLEHLFEPSLVEPTDFEFLEGSVTNATQGTVRIRVGKERYTVDSDPGAVSLDYPTEDDHRLLGPKHGAEASAKCAPEAWAKGATRDAGGNSP